MDSRLAKDQLLWLDLSNQHERSAYNDIWCKSSFKRPHDHSGFLDMMKPACYASMAVVYHHSENSKIIYPFFWCLLNKLPAFSLIKEPLVHMVSPYGYGAPLYEGSEDTREAALSEFEMLFQKELSCRGVVSEFVREDIFTKRLARRSVGKLIEQQPNVVVRLERSHEDIWQTYKSKVRKNVNRAKRSNLKVVFDPKGDYLDGFIEIYHETMRRTEASKNFFIPKEKFQIFLSTLGKDGGLMFVHVFDGMDMVSTELLLLSPDTIYSFLGGTLLSASNKRPNDLLKHEVITWGKENRYKWFVLGGGVKPGDGIYKFKEAFDPESILSFFVRNVIHNQEAYEFLIQKRFRYELLQGINWEPRTDFFPKYLS